jgi:hypothetical protein
MRSCSESTDCHAACVAFSLVVAKGAAVASAADEGGAGVAASPRGSRYMTAAVGTCSTRHLRYKQPNPNQAPLILFDISSFISGAFYAL